MNLEKEQKTCGTLGVPQVFCSFSKFGQLTGAPSSHPGTNYENNGR
jgi:hypothetical protein